MSSVHLNLSYSQFNSLQSTPVYLLSDSSSPAFLACHPVHLLSSPIPVHVKCTPFHQYSPLMSNLTKHCFNGVLERIDKLLELRTHKEIALDRDWLKQSYYLCIKGQIFSLLPIRTTEMNPLYSIYPNAWFRNLASHKLIKKEK